MARRTYSSRSSKSSLPLVLLLLLPAAGAGVYFGYAAGLGQATTEEAEPEPHATQGTAGLNTDPFTDPFAGIDLPDDRPTGYGRATDGRYGEWLLLCSDTQWRIAVDEVRQANVKLDDAERLHNREDPGWRTLAREGKHLLDAALDRTAPLVDRLDEVVLSARARQDLKDVRASWRRRAVDLHKTVGG